MLNPYPVNMVDEVSGVEVPNDKHTAWEEGHKAGIKEVVEWGNQPCDIKEHQIIGQVDNGVFYGHPQLKRNCEKCYQAKLKEWGIE